MRNRKRKQWITHKKIIIVTTFWHRHPHKPTSPLTTTKTTVRRPQKWAVSFVIAGSQQLCITPEQRENRPIKAGNPICLHITASCTQWWVLFQPLTGISVTLSVTGVYGGKKQSPGKWTAAKQQIAQMKNHFLTECAGQCAPCSLGGLLFFQTIVSPFPKKTFYLLHSQMWDITRERYMTRDLLLRGWLLTETSPSLVSGVDLSSEQQHHHQKDFTSNYVGEKPSARFVKNLNNTSLAKMQHFS